MPSPPRHTSRTTGSSDVSGDGGVRMRYVAEDAPTGYGDAADRLVNALRGIGTRVAYRGWSNTRAGEAPAPLASRGSTES